VSTRVETARRLVRRVLRDARDKNKWRKIVKFRLWMPVALQILLIGLLVWYTSSRFPGFLNETNIQNTLVLAVPLAIVAMAQIHALLVGYLDLSVGANISMGVVVASFLIIPGISGGQIMIGAGAVLLVGVTVGLVNAALVRGVKIPSIIATLAMLSILEGIALTLRPTPSGVIDRDFTTLLRTSIGPIPVAFIAVIVAAVAARRVAACQPVRPAPASRRLRRPLGQAQWHPHQRRAGARPAALGSVRRGGVVLRHGAIRDRQPSGRSGVHAQQHHGRRARWRRAEPVGAPPSSEGPSPRCCWP
jgi:hypothetical protein